MNIKITVSNLVFNFQDIRTDFISQQAFDNLTRLEKDMFGASFFSQGKLRRLILPQSKKVILITPQNQLIIEDASGALPKDSDLISKYSTNALEIVKNYVQGPTAYGFNYSAVISEVSSSKMGDAWVKSILPDVEILGIGNRIVYSENDARKDLRVNPNIGNESEFIFSLNAHYEIKNNKTPDYDELNELYIRNWKGLTSLIKRIFN